MWETMNKFIWWEVAWVTDGTHGVFAGQWHWFPLFDLKIVCHFLTADSLTAAQRRNVKHSEEEIILQTFLQWFVTGSHVGAEHTNQLSQKLRNQPNYA